MEAGPPGLDLPAPVGQHEQPSVLQKLKKWGDYVACGEVVLPTQFIPMKTPLGSEILENWNLEEPPQYPLSVRSLQMNQLNIYGRQIGLIIDLSNHETLYGADLQNSGINYEHVPLVAKIFPTQQAVNRVIEIADQFWSENPQLFIAIHCAYGFNRTGFVVCCYLIQVCNLSVDEALESFAAARPPGVRHDQFIAELHKRYCGAQRSAAIPFRPSIGDLRGFGRSHGRQTVESLQSDFLGVAEHLHENHPDATLRTTGSGQESALLATLEDCEPSIPDFQQPPSRSRSRSHLAGNSRVSVGTHTSTCESLNNESLDLDERDIYAQFTSRLATGGNIATSVNGRKRRSGGVKSSLPDFRHLEEIADPSVSSQNSNQSSLTQRSPFAIGADAQAAFAHHLSVSSLAHPDETAAEVSAISPPTKSSGHGEEALTESLAVDEDLVWEYGRGVGCRSCPKQAGVVEKENILRSPISERTIRSEIAEKPRLKDCRKMESKKDARFPCKIM